MHSPDTGAGLRLDTSVEWWSRAWSATRALWGTLGNSCAIRPTCTMYTENPPGVIHSLYAYMRRTYTATHAHIRHNIEPNTHTSHSADRVDLMHRSRADRRWSRVCAERADIACIRFQTREAFPPPSIARCAWKLVSRVKLARTLNTRAARTTGVISYYLMYVLYIVLPP